MKGYIRYLLALFFVFISALYLAAQFTRAISEFIKGL